MRVISRFALLFIVSLSVVAGGASAASADPAPVPVPDPTPVFLLVSGPGSCC